jgi:hypothetical protein
MRFFHSYKITKKTKLLAAAVLAAAYFIGFSASVYSPAHIGHYAIPIPVLIMPAHSAQSPSLAGSRFADSKVLSATSASPPAGFSHLDIITTYFWVGEQAGSDNGGIANLASTWDGQWQAHYGGVDAPTPRNGYNPAGFTPKENPFYFALPYSDIDGNGRRKTSAVNCSFSTRKASYSWCKNGWIAIRHNGKITYAQWEDAGPFGEDDTAYVFGGALPKNTKDTKAGLDVSPAVKDYLGLSDVDRADWVFIAPSAVPNGPWKAIITTDAGDSIN